MSYATLAEFSALGLPAVALDGFAGDVQDHLDMATGVVDTYLRGHYTLPLVEPYPQEIIQATCSIAAYNVMSIRGFNPDADGSKNIRMRYEDAKTVLRELSEGNLSLALGADSNPTEHSGAPIVLSKERNTARIFRGY